MTVLCLSCLWGGEALAQSLAVTGTVIDEAGEAVAGAGVVEKGSLNGTVTDVDGKFSLTVSSSSAVLEVSFIGFKTESVPVNGQAKLSVVLKSDDELLEEVLVIGYGTVKKKDLTGAVANVDGGKLASLQATSVSQALQGSMPGVQITRTSTMPGASATIRVRGVTTIGDSDPLIICDGVPVSSLDDVDVDAIENITVLKDAASASIYGARASAGVILITTKRAKDGDISVSYEGTFTVTTRTESPDMVGPQRFMELLNEADWNQGGNKPGNEADQYNPDLIRDYLTLNAQDPDAYPITDWEALMLKKWAPQHKHRVSVTYGNKVITSRAMLTYQDQDALYEGRSQENWTGRINNDIKINKFIKVSLDMTYNHRVSDNNVVNPVSSAFTGNPIYPAVWSDGTIAPGNNGSNAYGRLKSGGYTHGIRNVFYGKASVVVTPFKNFTITGVFAPSLRQNKEKDYTAQTGYYSKPGVLSKSYIRNCEYNELIESRTESMDFTKQLFINYKNDFDKHHLTYMVGYEDYYATTEKLVAGSSRMELGGYPYLNNANQNYLVSTDEDGKMVYPIGNASENAYRSFFGRVTYDYNGRYLVQLNARYDQSSRFNAENRGGFFPSASAAWVVTEEPFMKNVKNGKYLNFLKVRASYGTLGNERIGNYPWQAIMNFGSVPMYNADGTVSSATTAAQTAYAMRNITWETTKTWDVGFDLGMFNNRLNFTADLYRKDTYGMLLKRNIPSVLGYSSPEDNIGQMITNGWEFNIGWNDRHGDFTYAVNFNLSDYKSVMGDLGGYQSLGNQIIKEGVEYNAWYGYRSNGLFLTQEQLDNAATQWGTLALGNIQYKDLSGADRTPDGVINAEYDREVLGSSSPHFQYGGNINLGWKNFNLSMTFQGVGKVLAYKSQAMMFRTGDANNFPVEYDKWYWSAYKTDEQNAAAKYPRIATTNGATNDYDKTSDFWLFNGAYFRMKNITLSYTLPAKAVKAIKMQNIRVYASATDPFSIDKFPQGWDPETYTNTGAYMVRTFTLGAQLTF